MPPIISFVGYANSGKTTLLVKVIRELKHRGYKVGVIKHDGGHEFAIDRPRTDTWRHREAGADTVCIASASQLALIKQAARPPALEDLTEYFADVDIILTEGFKGGDQPQVEVNRPGIEPVGCKPNTIAVVAPVDLYEGVLCFAPDDIAGIADLLQTRIAWRERS